MSVRTRARAQRSASGPPAFACSFKILSMCAVVAFLGRAAWEKGSSPGPASQGDNGKRKEAGNKFQWVGPGEWKGIGNGGIVLATFQGLSPKKTDGFG